MLVPASWDRWNNDRAVTTEITTAWGLQIAREGCWAHTGEGRSLERLHFPPPWPSEVAGPHALPLQASILCPVDANIFAVLQDAQGQLLLLNPLQQLSGPKDLCLQLIATCHFKPCQCIRCARALQGGTGADLARCPVHHSHHVPCILLQAPCHQYRALFPSPMTHPEPCSVAVVVEH